MRDDILDDDWVRFSKDGVWSILTCKASSLDESFALQVRRSSALLDVVHQTYRLVVDLKQVVVASSSGIALLVEVFQAMPPGARLYVLHANVEISGLLRDTGLEQLFPMVEHMHDLPMQKGT